MNCQKEIERDEIHRKIWALADDLRGTIDGWDFKNYILLMMFYRFISEKGFIAEEESFKVILEEGKHNPNLDTTLESVFNHIEENSNFKGLFSDFDTNSTKLGANLKDRNNRLIKLMNGIANINLGNVQNHAVDTFGDAYEYLMTMYASNAGKSGGEFFTPLEVSELLTKLGTIDKNSIENVYDPSCGSGSLLLQCQKILNDNIKGFYGQDINITTYNLCKINMILHGIEFDKIHIANGDTLLDDKYPNCKFELIVSNPPYSVKWIGEDDKSLINDPRFSPAGVLAPKSKADLAFVLHVLYHLKENGIGLIVVFPGILYRGGNEQKIRKYLVDNNYVDCIIQLPANLFFGTSIATCIMVLKKNKKNSSILFIDATNECIKVTNNNKLTSDNINRIVEVFTSRENIEHFSQLVTYEKIKETDYNLSVSSYVETNDNSEIIDIDKLNAEIESLIKKENQLREEIDKIIAEIN